ncbi:MAG TPA: hypothetical protein VFZ64_04040 [Nocardioidaceae bacterium]
MPSSVSFSLRALVVTLVTVALTGLPGPLPVTAMPIEGYPSYQPQTTCSPRAKAGTVMLSKHLLARYPGSGSSGISRSCEASGTSEHKEGRAFDWRLSATSKRDRGFASDFISRLRATDKWGNRNALARRMGIMYVIWNDHIWSASRGYRKRDYLHSACSKPSTCSVTLRHRDHMHISLTRRAARGKTSWYVQRKKRAAAPASAPKPATPSPKPAPKPTPKPASQPEPPKAPRGAPKDADGVLDLRRVRYVRVTVPTDGSVRETKFKLKAGETYSLTAAGVYSYGRPDQVADAACSWSPRDRAWRSKPRPAVRRQYGRLALWANGKLRFGTDCRGSHTYRTSFTPTRTGPLKLKVWARDTKSRGRLTVVVGRPAARVAEALPDYPSLTSAPTYASTPRNGHGLLDETVTVSGSTAAARYTVGSLKPRATYRVTVSGLVDLGPAPLGGRAASNGQCVRIRGKWYDAASIDPRVPDQDHGQLYVNGQPFRSSGGCRAATRVGEVRASAGGRMRLDLWDPLSRSDNTGSLTVRVQRVTPIATPVAAERENVRPRQAEWKQRRDDLVVGSDRRKGRVSTMRLRRGERVRVLVSGRFTSGGRRADASCVLTSEGWRTTDPGVLTQDPLNLWVDGSRARWRASTGGRGCAKDASYRAVHTATKPGPLRLAVFDLDHTDNEGSLKVTLRRLKR